MAAKKKMNMKEKMAKLRAMKGKKKGGKSKKGY